MSKKLSISQPTIIDFELSPLSDSFWLDTDGDSVEQWYNPNEKKFSPDRGLKPLLITPKLSVVDTLTGQKYEDVTIASAQWFALENTPDGWVESEIYVNASDENLNSYLKSHDYIKYFNKLYVTKNNPSAESQITIKCIVKYIDPRDTGRLTKVESSIALSTSVDATVLYPELSILAPATITFNPLVAESSKITLKANANWEGIPYKEGEVEGEERGSFIWDAINDNGKEVRIETMPYYVSGGYNKDEVTIDAMYADGAKIILRTRRKNETNVLPPKATVNVAWVTTPIQGTIVSENGNTLRGTSEKFSFYTIVNTNSGQLSEDKIREHLRFKWMKRPATAKKTSSSSTPTDTYINLGWGERIEVKAEDMMAFGGTKKAESALITNEIYLVGAYRKIQYNGEDITYNDKKLYGRTI